MAEDQKPLTTQEINTLRKSGKLEDALGHARLLLESDANDPWIIRTLFWCLYDEFKRVQTANDSAAIAAVTKEVGLLKLPNEESDQVMHDCAARILGTDPIAKATQLSKSGKHHDAVALLRPIAKGANVTSVIGDAYSWILYRKLKEEGADQPEVTFWCLNEFLGCWSSDWDPNIILFKCILFHIKNHAEGWNGLVPLVEKLELHRIPATDFADDRPDTDYAPFQDQLLGAVHKCLKKHPAMRQQRPQLQLWLDAWANSFSDDQWPQYHLGHILLWIDGDKNKAKILLLKTVQRNPGDFWRWQALAEALDGEEKKIAMARGIVCQTEDPSFMVRLYKDFANLLAAEQALPEATASLNEAIRLCNLSGNEWRDPFPAWHTSNEAESLPNIHDYAKTFADTADQLLAADLPIHVGVIIKETDKPGRQLYYIDGLGVRNLAFPHNNLPPTSNPAIQAKFQDQPKGICKVLTWEKTQISDDAGTWQEGIVAHVNKAKGLTAVKTSVDETILLHFDRWPEARELTSGSFVKLQCLGDQGQKPIVAKFLKTPPTSIPDLNILVKGLFRRARDKKFGFINVGDLSVFVPPHVAGTLLDSTIVEGWAIRSKKKDGALSWELLPIID
ncbi:MAG: hypothetical protein KJO21_01100 [Verrucomicrobiae bacterium]|nr:hypothetical protein [Verrucomicrobiae bacterium]NNJ42131.1 hypothetical protein [Akkermansiaceae bacterium]